MGGGRAVAVMSHAASGRSEVEPLIVLGFTLFTGLLMVSTVLQFVVPAVAGMLNVAVVLASVLVWRFVNLSTAFLAIGRSTSPRDRSSSSCGGW